MPISSNVCFLLSEALAPELEFEAKKNEWQAEETEQTSLILSALNPEAEPRGWQPQHPARKLPYSSETSREQRQ
ncbi:hypothetical protein DIPPA_01869 [Diplonema papillatum]|nr:hypothetical protein DIPPA_01869 [Diplonema papillatum]